MYELIYDISQETFTLYYPVLFLLVALVIVIFVYKGNSNAKNAKIITLFLSSVLSIICIWMVLSTYLEFKQLQTLARNETCQTVQGKIEQFHGKSILAKRPESFIVNGVYFEYSNGISRNGYRKIKGYGGLLRDGIGVKICYANGMILKLEIMQ